MGIPALPFSRFNTSVPKPLGNKYISAPQTLGNKIRNRRLELGLLQKDLAVILNTVEESIYRWETNRNLPEMKYMPNIIDFLGYFPFEIDTSTLGGQIKKYRYYHGLSQEELAKLLEINESTIFHYEKRSHKPTPNILKRMKSLAILS